jgi:hypothetical protein
VPELKAVLFDAYNRFADKRVKNLDKASTFLVDDRDPGVIGADKRPLSWFCQIYAHAIADDQLRVTLTNAPLSEKIVEWAAKKGGTVKHAIMPILDLTVPRGKQGRLDELASLMRAIVEPGALRATSGSTTRRLSSRGRSSMVYRRRTSTPCGRCRRCTTPCATAGRNARLRPRSNEPARFWRGTAASRASDGRDFAWSQCRLIAWRPLAISGG